MCPLYRSDMGHISVSVAGVGLDNQSWDFFEGGDHEIESQKYNPGGMQPQVALGGKGTRSDITIRRAYSDSLVGIYKTLDAVAGQAAVTCSFQTLAADKKTPVGDPIVYTGILGNVTRPNYDSMTSTAQQLQILISPNETIS